MAHQREPRERVAGSAARLRRYSRDGLQTSIQHGVPLRRAARLAASAASAVPLHQHRATGAAPQVAERPQRKGHAPRRPDGNRGVGRLADGTAGRDRAREHRQPAAAGEPLDQACVGAAFHDEADRRRCRRSFRRGPPSLPCGSFSATRLLGDGERVQAERIQPARALDQQDRRTAGKRQVVASRRRPDDAQPGGPHPAADERARAGSD